MLTSVVRVQWCPVTLIGWEVREGKVEGDLSWPVFSFLASFADVIFIMVFCLHNTFVICDKRLI